MARLQILLLVACCLLLSGMNMILLCRWRMIITSCPGVCGLNILVLHPLYAGSHVLTLHSLRNTSDILVTIIAFLGGFQATNKTFCHLLLHSVRNWIYFWKYLLLEQIIVALVLKLKIGQNKPDDFVQWGAARQGPHYHHHQGTIRQQLSEINVYLVSTQFRDDDLPALRYGANHTLVVKSLNNSRGDLPFMTHSDEVGDTRIKMVCWADL